MFFVHRAYLNASGTGQVLNLTHDVKRGLADSKVPSGLVTILSTQATTAVALLEGDPVLQKEYFAFAKGLFDELSDEKAARRSGTGANKHHLMAAVTGLSLTVPFESGRLSTSPFHDIVALDFEPKPGRREFLITVLGDAAPK